MGNHKVTDVGEHRLNQKFTEHLLNDIEVLEILLKENKFENDIVRIGAEQELVLVDKNYKPSSSYHHILKEANDPDLTTELARFNLEINLPPLTFHKNALSEMHRILDQKLKKLEEIGDQHKTKILLTGILPTINWEHLKFDWMTPNPRYEALNKLIRQKRDANFEINIKGLDELVTNHPNILFEACNTSFQIHLQVNQHNFTEMYNWSQLIAAPILAVSCNSPILMGKRLWNETRIALFQQSIDTRNSQFLKREIEPRVTFGKNWIKNSVAELYKQNIKRFNTLIAPENLEDSLALLKKNKNPKLSALCVHSGTVYSWNRACYGKSENGKPHLRIENRYIPSGPTTEDEIANTALWTGTMMGMPSKLKGFENETSFSKTRQNFYKAAQFGLESNFHFLGKTISAKKLLLNTILPMAEIGLNKMNIDPKDISHYLGIIHNRIQSKQTGAHWIQKNYSDLIKNKSRAEANTIITRQIWKNQDTKKPVHEWPKIENKNYTPLLETTAQHIMQTDFATVQENDIIELATNFMVWNNVRYVMVEDSKHRLVGLVSSRAMIKKLKEGWPKNLIVSEIMNTQLQTITPNTLTTEALKIMTQHKIGCLPVLVQSRLVGIVTERGIIKHISEDAQNGSNHE